jgi:DNA-directed RNA polymerase specialized sigma subunit
MFFEIIGELGLNIPMAVRESQKGENISSTMSILFAILPMVKYGAGLGKISDETAQILADKLAKANIQTEKELLDFIKTLPESEKLAMNMVLKQDPKNLKKISEDRKSTRLNSSHP